MTILVTGGCGFIGSNLVPMLEKSGEKVIVFDNMSKGKASNIEDTEAQIVEGDIRDAAAVADVIQSVDKVVHLAAAGNVVESVDQPADNFDINVFGTFVVLDEARKAGIKKLVFASTGGALMGNTPPPVSETSLPTPISPYLSLIHI